MHFMRVRGLVGTMPDLGFLFHLKIGYSPILYCYFRVCTKKMLFVSDWEMSPMTNRSPGYAHSAERMLR